MRIALGLGIGFRALSSLAEREIQPGQSETLVGICYNAVTAELRFREFPFGRGRLRAFAFRSTIRTSGYRAKQS